MRVGRGENTPAGSSVIDIRVESRHKHESHSTLSRYRNSELVASSAGVMRPESCGVLLSSPCCRFCSFLFSVEVEVEVEVESCRWRREHRDRERKNDARTSKQSPGPNVAQL